MRAGQVITKLAEDAYFMRVNNRVTQAPPVRNRQHDNEATSRSANIGRNRMSYGPPWAHYLGGYQDRLLGGPLGLPDLRCTAPAGVKHKDYRGEVLS
jgi:hypothetical protein